ncbi:MAG: class I SAM-dependent methyltransferase [Candidatus Spyradocola sp.]
MKTTRDFYDKTAQQWWDRCAGDERLLPCLHRVLEGLPERPRVLDLCCGAGYESLRLCRMGARVVGVDFSAESLAIARRECPQAQFFEADMRGDLSFLGQFDAAVCIAGFVHLRDDELSGVFRSLAGLLPCGAPLLVTVKDGEGYAPGMSLTVIDGQKYDRRFYLHSAEALCAAAAPEFRYAQELLPEPGAAWRKHLFIRC